MPVIYNRSVTAAVIQYYVNNPDLPLEQVGAGFGMSRRNVSHILSKHYFGPGKKGTIITKSSVINEMNVTLKSA